MDPWQPCCPATNSSRNPTPNVDGLELHNGDIRQENGEDHHHHHHQIQQTNLENSEAFQDQNQNSGGGDLTFGDNFKPFIKLPDSQEYLDSLENKLKAIKKGGNKGPSADSILRSLGQTKESCMIKLLSNSVEQLTTEGEIFEDLKVNPLLKKLAPEKQALSTEELVHLLKADQLEIILNNNSEEGESSEITTQLVPEVSIATPDAQNVPDEPSTEKESGETTSEATKEPENTVVDL